jgi:3-hydroxyacyl-[acyl-carrier-protein] dehydratase
VKEDVERALTDVTVDLTPGHGSATARLSFPAELAIFQGHFPGFAVVPGVYLVEAARLLGERLLGRCLIIRAVDMAKFSAAIGPDEWVEASLALTERTDGFLCEARFRCRATDAARLRLHLSSPSEED